MDFSFEKTNSAYMLFYERKTSESEQQSCSMGQQSTSSDDSITVDTEEQSTPIEEELASPSKPSISLNESLEQWIWEDNINFLQDRNIFQHTYFK